MIKIFTKKIIHPYYMPTKCSRKHNACPFLKDSPRDDKTKIFPNASCLIHLPPVTPGMVYIVWSNRDYLDHNIYYLLMGVGVGAGADHCGRQTTVGGTAAHCGLHAPLITPLQELHFW